MRLSDILGLAFDNLKRALLRTSLTATGVAIGTAAVVLLVAFGNGFESMAVRHAATFGGVTTVTVYPVAPGRNRRSSGQLHTLTPAAVASMRRLPHVASVGATLATPSLRLIVGSHALDLSSAAQSPLAQNITLTKGSDTAAAERDGVLVPASAARGLGPQAALLGRRVTLAVGGTVGGGNAQGGMVVIGPERHFSAHIAGFYDDSQMQSRDNTTAPLIIPTALGAEIDGGISGMSAASYLRSRGYSQVYVQTNDARQTATVASKISAMSYLARDRADLLAQVHLIFAILKGGLGAIGGIALLVAAVGIANTLIMTILERTREIGIMKALGAEPGMVRRLFLAETALVGFIGGLLGLALAAAGSAAGNVVFAIWLKGQGVSASQGNLFLIPATLAVGAVALAIAISLLAGMLPSRRAIRLQPLDALRYE